MDKKKQNQINELGDLIFKRIKGADLDDISDCVIEIWNAGYRKIPEGAVVLTQEACDMLKMRWYKFNEDKQNV